MSDATGPARAGPRPLWVRVALPLVLVYQAACAAVPQARTDRVTFDQAQAAWARVLGERVDTSGRVAFRALASDREDLDRYLRYVSEVDPARDPQRYPSREHQLAHRINAYNALSMYGVLRAGIPATNAGLRKIPFFFLWRYRVEGRRQTLYRFEKTIRDLGDPRVHFALNCMSVSCPRLPQEPFAGARLEAQLERQAREFFTDPGNLEVDSDAGRVRVSSILQFYQAEFEREAGSLIGYINRYRSEPIPESFEVDFLPYDWTINQSDRVR